ncbi:MAG: class I SAM-dependent methyltransferase [Anaerolineae bacterium]|jgi:2-polyprenyl-3-methyl-5-hydroxy-6-metoxy-1,4-benzoquinol methylase|nr:class I SAM-dependent methyltransferase [Anaerolineae bacterium]
MAHLLQRLVRRLRPVAAPPAEPMAYRRYLLQELLTHSRHDWAGRRLLEIGPRDGLDSQRLAALQPAELVMIDLPEKRDRIQGWLQTIACPYRYLEANYMYMSAAALQDLGTFDLVWCTGVLYHNPEQLRLLRRLYTALKPDGWLVLESATTRHPLLKDLPVVELHYPQRYRDTSTVTHLPTVTAIKAWLRMVGFLEVIDSGGFAAHHPELVGSRYACLCHKTGVDDGDVYYTEPDNPPYRFGDST